MKVKESSLFKSFAAKHFGPKEEVVYKLQLMEIWADKKPGRIEKSLKTQDGEACVSYYFYDKRDETIYVLAAHLARKGEPRQAETEAVERYIHEIETG